MNERGDASRRRGAVRGPGLGAAAVLAVLAGGAPSSVSAQDNCVDCHEGLRGPQLRGAVEEVRESIHGEQDIGCSECHGGNTNVSTVQAHQSEDFRSRVEAAAMPETCGDCHAERDRFAEEVPTDQLTGYRLSVHGQAFARGNWKAASCWDCHGNHLVLPPEDPGSKVHPSQVAETCSACHEDEERMKGSGLPTDQVAQWRDSVHGRAHEEWIAEGSPKREGEGPEHPPTCHDCHGEHEIAEPEHAVEACTGCHDEAWEAFRASPHREAFEKKGFLPCVECHGSHDIEAVDASLLGIEREAACRKCHRRGQEMAETIAELARLEREAEQAAADARAALEQAGDPKAQESLALLQEQERDLRIAIHSLDDKRIEHAARKLEKLATRVKPEISDQGGEDVFQRRLRTVIIGLTVAVIIALAGFVRWTRKRS